MNTGNRPLLNSNTAGKNKANSKTKLATHKQPWSINTILITGDSLLNGLQESRLNGKKHVVKVSAFSGADIEDMYSYLSPS